MVRNRLGVGNGLSQAGLGARAVDPAVATEQVRNPGLITQGIVLGHAAFDQWQHRLGRPR
ncbi:hypothetical protein D3C87_1916090 [compost metagenome]